MVTLFSFSYKVKEYIGLPSFDSKSFLLFILITDSTAYSSDSVSVNSGVKPFLYSTTICFPNLLGMPTNLIALSSSIICLHMLCKSIVIFDSVLYFSNGLIKQYNITCND